MSPKKQTTNLNKAEYNSPFNPSKNRAHKRKCMKKICEGCPAETHTPKSPLKRMNDDVLKEESKQTESPSKKACHQRKRKVVKVRKSKLFSVEMEVLCTIFESKCAIDD